MLLRCTVFGFVVILCFSTYGQTLDFERGRYKSILTKIKEDVQKNYFDPNFKGIDLNGKFRAAAEKINSATSISQMNSTIAQFLLDFDDSHLFYIPPGKANQTDYGFDFRMFGDKCLVFKVEKDSDAAKKGLQVGDEIYSLEGFAPNRENLWKMKYFYRALSPRPFIKLDITKPDGKTQELTVAAKVRPGKRMLDLTGSDIFEFMREGERTAQSREKHRIYEHEGFSIWRLPSFDLDPSKVDQMVDNAGKQGAIIFDLRDNGGGRVDMLLRLISKVFEYDVAIGEERKRKETKKMTAKTVGKDAYKGKIVILLDSGSGSAAELFSRVVQLENRGKIIGERSAGAVMESMFFGREEGLDTVVFFATSITVADVVMKDGKSLEKIGVIPDITVVPSGKELAAGHDPVLAKALELLGIKMTSEAAGAIRTPKIEK